MLKVGVKVQIINAPNLFTAEVPATLYTINLRSNQNIPTFIESSTFIPGAE